MIAVVAVARVTTVAGPAADPFSASPAQSGSRATITVDGRSIGLITDRIGAISGE